MWIDNDSPGCFLDTIDCNGKCCEEGRKMYEEYLKEKYGEENNDNQMKCFYCKNNIDENKPYKITEPDGDIFHIDCLKEYEKEREIFFNEIIIDDDKFANWLGIDF